MARYNTNTPRKSTKTVNHQGGISYKLDAKLELISILMTGFDNAYYETLNQREQRFKDLIAEVAYKDAKFVAKALIYTRSIVGQRSITHFGSAILAKYLSGVDFGKYFYSKRSKKENKGGIVRRLDDILEIMAAYQAINPGKTLPNSMKKGFKLALENADTYELAKYQGKGKGISLVDVVNLVHPSPKPHMQETFKSLMEGNLKQFNTVEDKNTKVGQEIATKVKSGEITKEDAEKELKQAKGENFAELIATKKIGYLALLRNLRNILNTGNTQVLDEAMILLQNEEFIRKSLVFPHQIDLALETLMLEGVNTPPKLISALSKAYELSIPNLADAFEGRTAVVFDSSGSMTTSINVGGKRSRYSSAIDKAALVAATFAKAVHADVFHFANYTAKIKYNPNDSINSIKKLFKSHQGRVGYGTEFNSIFSTIGDSYDRVFIISDMQGRSYLRNVPSRPYIYNVDMTGYGTTMLPTNRGRNFQLFGYSAEMYELAKKVEINPKVILEEIEKIEI